MNSLSTAVLTFGLFASVPLRVGAQVTNAPAPTVPAVAPQPAGQAAMAAAAAKTEQDILKAERDRFNAMVKADAGDLDKLLAVELIYTHSNAQIQDKTGFIADIKSGAIKYVSIEPSELKVRVFENAAFVTGIAAMHVLENGNDLTLKIRYTSAHVERRGGWQLVSWQATRIP